MADGSKSIDELLEQARRLKAQTQQGQEDAKRSEIKTSAVTDTLKDIKAFNQTAKEVNGGYQLVKHTGLSVWNFLKNNWVSRAYMKVFNKFCYKKDKETGERKLRPTRAKAMILTTAFMASALVPGMIGTPARTTIGAVTEPVMDGVRMTAMMHKNEVMYLNDQHIYDAKENVWVVKGTTDPNGSVENTVLFKVKPSLAHDLWQWKNKGDPFFKPDRVVGPIAPGANNKCIVTYYGSRWRVANWLEAYPYLLDVKCESTPAANFNQAAKPGQEVEKPAVQQQAPVPKQQTAPIPAPSR
jgi:hypothetical protein